jgi:hypothetical protein
MDARHYCRLRQGDQVVRPNTKERTIPLDTYRKVLVSDAVNKRANNGYVNGGRHMRDANLLRRVIVSLVVITALLSIALQLAAAQSDETSGKATPPPPNWIEKFTGAYGDSENHVPPGYPPYSTLHPFRSIDSIIAPLLKPWAAARKEESEFEIEEEGSFCRPTGLLMAHQNRGFQLVVSPGRITLIGTELPGRAIRRVYLNRDHRKDVGYTSLGDSVAHWEGDTLVVDAIGFDDRSFLDLEGARHSSDLHVVERWRLVADGKWMERKWLVDDPRALKAPFTFTRYHEKLPANTHRESELCLDFDGWRTWVGLRNDAVRSFDEQRATEAKALARKK